MRLITEHFDSLEYITEDKDGKKGTYITGVFMQAEQKNRNGRIYPKETLFNAVEKYVNEQVSKGRAVGELDHPEGPQINLDKVSHKITELKFDGDNVVGKAQVLNTPMGRIVEGLIEGGVKLGVSSRGMGTVENKQGATIVNDDYLLATVDIVQDPSAQGAFVNGIMEGVEWIWDNGILRAQQLEKYETEISNASAKNLASVQEQVFKDFLSKL